MNEHLSLPTCQRLKAAGYPQTLDGWDGDYEALPEMPLREDAMLCVTSDGRLFYELPDGDQVIIPPIITADGKGGVLPWLENLGEYLERYWNSNGLPVWAPHGEEEEYESPEALIVAVLDQMEAQ